MGAKQFSKLDASLGFWQIKFDKETSNLLAFGTTTGIFRLKWFGKTLAEQDSCLSIILLKVRVSGLKLNKNKCQFCKEPIAFEGHMIFSKCIWVDSSKLMQ